jgi:hypothetical protein
MNRDPFALLPAADSSGAERDTWAPILPASDPLPEGATADTVLDTLAQAVAEPPRAETPGDALRADVARAALMARED